MALDNRGGVGLTVYVFANPDTMATPVGIILGAGLAVLTIIAMHMINEALEENFRQMDAYINGEISGDEIVHGFIWNVVLTAATFGLAKGIEKGVAYAAEQYLTKVVGSRLAGGLLSEGVSPTGLVRAVKNMKTLGYTDDFIRELADNISAEQLIRMNRMNRKGLGKGFLDILFGHSRQLGNYSDDLIWQLERAGSYTDDILKLVDNYGEAFTRQIGADDLSRLGGLVNKGLTDDVVDAVIRHADHFADYSDDTIKKITESGCNAERILTQIDNYAKDFTEDLTAGQLKRLDDILEQGITPEQFEVLLNHAGQLDDYTDEVIGLWRNYSGNGDDFLRLVDQYGKEFITSFKTNGDVVIGEFNDLMEGRISAIVIKETDNFTDYLNRTGNKIRIPNQTSKVINNSIASKLTSDNVGVALEARVADYINNNTDATIIDFANEVKIVNGRTIGDIDISTQYQLIEVKNSMSSVDAEQFRKYIENAHPDFFNFSGKEVLLYIDKPIDWSNLRGVEELEKIEDMGVRIINGLEELEKVVK